MINKKQIVKVISASLLGDGTIYREENKNGNFRIKQLAIHLDHLQYLKEQLEILTNIQLTPINTERINKIICDKQSVSNPTYFLKTMNHPLYTKFRQRMYPNGFKVVDPHYLKLMDAEFLAIWYQQDGMLEKQRLDTINCGACICTDNFSYGDNMLLRQALIEKTGLIWNIRPKSTNKLGNRTYRLHLYRKQFERFQEYIRPFIQPSFLYKIEHQAYENTKSQSDLISDDKSMTEMIIPNAC